MNCLIDLRIKERGNKEIKGYGLIGFGDVSMNSHFRYKDTNKCKISNTSLPWEILETAYYFFQKKGFEKTTLSDICKKLNINNSEFYKHFESLDEVLEILWAR